MRHVIPISKTPAIASLNVVALFEFKINLVDQLIRAKSSIFS